MNVNYSENARLLGFDVLFILMWVGGWGLMEILISYIAKDRTLVQMGLYMTCFLAAALISVLVQRPS